MNSEPDTAATDLDVIVVGAGFTGVSAARELDALGLSVLVLDAYTDHLGGRAYSFDGDPAAASDPSSSGLRFDHGAQYVGDLQNEIMSIIEEKLPAGSLVNGANLRLPYPYEVMVLDQKRYCFKSTDSAFGIPGVPPDLGFTELLGMIGLLAEMTLIEWSIDIMEPWNATGSLRELDQIDTWTWLNDKWWVSATVRDLLRISIEALLSVEPSQVSPYYVLWYTACNDGFLNEINDDAGGPQQYWLRRGTDEIAAAIAEPVKAKGRIRQGCRVASIDQTGDRVVVTLEGGPAADAPQDPGAGVPTSPGAAVPPSPGAAVSQGETLRAKKVLVATSPATAGRIAFAPELPPARRTFMQQPMGKTIKCQIFYRTAWWHDSKGKAYDGYVGGANYPVLWVMDSSPPPSDGLDTHVLMTFTVGAQADTLGPDPTHEAITKFVTDALATLFDDERAKPGQGQFIRLVTHRWLPSDPFVGGGPNTVFAPKMLTSDVGKVLDQHEGHVFFACAENAKALRPRSTSSRYAPFAPENLPQYDAESVLLPTSKAPFYSKYSDRRSDLGYMSGAIESGRYVAHEIARALGKPDQLPAPAVSAAGAGEPPPPPPLGEHLASDVAAVLAALREKVEALAVGHFGAFGLAEQAQGRTGTASWLRDAILEAAQCQAQDGAVSGSPGRDAASALTYLRDFAATTAKYVQTDPSTHHPDVQPHVQSILEHVRAIEAHIAAKLSP